LRSHFLLFLVTICGSKSKVEYFVNKSAYILCLPVIANPQISLICLHIFKSICVINTPSFVLESPGVRDPSGAATYELP